MNNDKHKCDVKRSLPYGRATAFFLLLTYLILPAHGESVRLYRDAYGVPHVFGESLAGAYYGAGYAVAEDLKWGLSQLALKAEGRQCEFFGRQSGMLDEDIFSRHFHFYKDALEKFPQLSAETQAAIRAYTKGIAARYAELGQLEPRPDWAIDVTPEHLAATFLAANFYQSAYQAKDHELKEMGVQLPFPYIGSNAFAIGPAKTADGSTIHFGGPQTPFGNCQPEIHLEWPGGRVAGYGYGLSIDPGVGLTHAWASTANWPDTSDSWKLKLDPAREGIYWDPLAGGGKGAWAEMTLMMFTVEVRGERPRQYRRWETRFGPVLWIDQQVRNDEVEEAFAYTWRPSGWGRIEYIDAMMRKQWAASMREAMAAADPPEIVSGNWIMADQKGNLGFLYNGRIPARADDTDYRLVQTANGANEWAGWFYGLKGRGVLPSILNPASGFLISANEAPWFVSSSGEVAGRESWPNFVVPPTGWGAGATVRGERLRELIGGPDKRLRFEEAGALPFDVQLPKAHSFIGQCLSNYEKKNSPTLSIKAAEVQQLLAAWDGRASADSPGMTAAFYLVKNLGPWADTAEAAAAVDEQDAPDAAAYATALESAARQMQQNYGRTSIPWGEIHGMAVGGQWIPLSGGTDFLPAIFQAHAGEDAGTDKLGGDGKIRCSAGSVYLAITRFARDGKMERYSIGPNGQHNPQVWPESPHCRDQAPLFAAGRYKRFFLNEDELQSNLTPYEGQPGYAWKARKEIELVGE